MTWLYTMQTITVIVILAMNYMLFWSFEAGDLTAVVLFGSVLWISWGNYKNCRKRIRVYKKLN